MNRQTTDNTICGEIVIKLVPVIQRINLCPRNRAFSHDVTAAILVFQNKETAAMLVFQTSPMGVELFSYVKKMLLFPLICINAGHVSENALLTSLTLFRRIVIYSVDSAIQRLNN